MTGPIDGGARPRLLVVGADSLRAGALASLGRRGYSVTLVDGGTSHQYEHLVDRFVFAEASDELSDYEFIAGLARKHDGVISLSDGSQQVAAAVAESSGLPSPGVRATRTARDKGAQRRLAFHHGLDQPRWAPILSDDDLVTFLDSTQGKAVVKPSDGGGGMAVSVVGDLPEARRAWHLALAFSKSSSAIIEEYVAGIEVSVEAVVEKGSVVFWSVTDKELGGPSGVIELSHTAHSSTHALRRTLQSPLVDLLSAIEFDTGLLHAEFRVDGDAVYLIEFGARPAGGFIAEITLMATGMDLYWSLGALSVGQQPPTPRPPAHDVAMVQFLLGTGRVRRRAVAGDLGHAPPGVTSVGQLIPPGCQAPRPTGNWGYAGYVIGGGDEPGALAEHLAQAGDRLLEVMGLSRLDDAGSPSGASVIREGSR